MPIVLTPNNLGRTFETSSEANKFNVKVDGTTIEITPSGALRVSRVDVANVAVSGNELVITFSDGTSSTVTLPASSSSSVAISDSTSINLSGDGSVATPLTADIVISSDSDNVLESRPNGIYAPGGLPDAPSDSQIYGRSNGSWVPATAGTALVVSSGTLTNGNSILSCGNTAILTSVSSDVPARIRLYSTSAGRALDSSRAIGVTPDKAADLIFEFVAVVGFLGAVCNPTPIATNGDFPQNGYIYANVESTNTATVFLSYIDLGV